MSEIIKTNKPNNVEGAAAHITNTTPTISGATATGTQEAPSQTTIPTHETADVCVKSEPLGDSEEALAPAPPTISERMTVTMAPTVSNEVRVKSEPIGNLEETVAPALPSISEITAETTPTTAFNEVQENRTETSGATLEETPIDTLSSTHFTTSDKTSERQTTTEAPAPPPPVIRIKTELGTFISNTNVDETEDGELGEESELVDDNFFDDLLQSADEIGAAAMLSPTRPTIQAVTPVVAEGESSAIRIKAEPGLTSTETAETRVCDQEDATMPLTEETTATTPEVTASFQPTSIKNEPAAFADDVAPPPTQQEAIPEHFFDDLLVDRLAQRLQNHQSEELEMKYADKLQMLRGQLRELEEAEKSQTCAADAGHSKSHKKKKSKKKSRKRSRSRSRSRSTERKRNKRMEELPKVTPVEEEQASTSCDNGRLPLTVKSEFRTFGQSVYAGQLECLPVQFPAAVALPTTAVDASSSGFRRIKLERRLSKETTTIAAVQQIDDEVELVITPKMKRDRAVDRAAAILKEFQRAQQDEIKSATPPLLTRFNYTATVRKLPTSSSYVTQQIYENRSPLHTVNNVSYRFNSHATRFNLQEWGLEALSTPTARIAKILGYDAQTLNDKLKTTRLPARFAKIKNEAGIDVDDGECVDETRSSFFTNAMTQTDPVTVTAARQRNNGHDVAVQATPHSGSFGTQTDETLEEKTPQSRTAGTNDDLPLMQLIGTLNENQLMALHDFAELLQEDSNNGNAMDMYRLRQRMLDIYKCAQLPSAMASASSAPVSGATPMIVPPPKTSPIQISAVYSMPPIDPRTGAPVVRKYVQQQQQQQQQQNHQQNHQQHQQHAPTLQQQQQRPTYMRTPQNLNAPPRSHHQMQQQQHPMSSQQQQLPAYKQRPPYGSSQQQTGSNPNAAPTAPKYYGRGGLRR